MDNRKVNIIGGGMAGLCAGSYLQMNGYDVTITGKGNHQKVLSSDKVDYYHSGAIRPASLLIEILIKFI